MKRRSERGYALFKLVLFGLLLTGVGIVGLIWLASKFGITIFISQ